MEGEKKAKAGRPKKTEISQVKINSWTTDPHLVQIMEFCAKHGQITNIQTCGLASKYTNEMLVSGEPTIEKVVDPKKKMRKLENNQVQGELIGDFCGETQKNTKEEQQKKDVVTHLNNLTDNSLSQIMGVLGLPKQMEFFLARKKNFNQILEFIIDPYTGEYQLLQKQCSMNFEQRPSTIHKQLYELNQEDQDRLTRYIKRIDEIRFMISNGFREILIDIAQFILQLKPYDQEQIIFHVRKNFVIYRELVYNCIIRDHLKEALQLSQDISSAKCNGKTHSVNKVKDQLNQMSENLKRVSLSKESLEQNVFQTQTFQDTCDELSSLVKKLLQ